MSHYELDNGSGGEISAPGAMSWTFSAADSRPKVSATGAMNWRLNPVGPAAGVTPGRASGRIPSRVAGNQPEFSCGKSEALRKPSEDVVWTQGYENQLPGNQPTAPPYPSRVNPREWGQVDSIQTSNSLTNSATNYPFTNDNGTDEEDDISAYFPDPQVNPSEAMSWTFGQMSGGNIGGSRSNGGAAACFELVRPRPARHDPPPFSESYAVVPEHVYTGSSPLGESSHPIAPPIDRDPYGADFNMSTPQEPPPSYEEVMANQIKKLDL